MVALLSTVLLLSTALVVDLGQQRVGRADMQSLADMVALDLARELNGRTVDVLTPLMPGLAAKSEARNQSVIDYRSNPPTLTVVLGSWDDSRSPRFTKMSSGVPNAVEVLAGTNVGFAFGGVTGVLSGGANRTAYGTATNESCVNVGSYAARINSQNSLLLNTLVNKALGGNLSLTAVSYSGLANANISLLGLATQLGLGDVDQLLSTDVSLSKLYLAAANVLKQGGDTADANILDTIAASTTLAQSVKLGSLISAESGSKAAETATIDALSLLQGSVEIANGSSAVDIPGLTANALGLASVTTRLSLIQAAQTGCGEPNSSTAQAKTAQATLAVDGKINPLTVLGFSVSGTTGVTVNAASARAALAAITCGADTTASPTSDQINATSSLVSGSVNQTLTLSNDITNSGGSGLSLTSLLNGLSSLLTSLLDPVVKISISGTYQLSTSIGEGNTTKSISTSFPPNTPGSGNWSSPVDTGSGDLGLDDTGVTGGWIDAQGNPASGPTIKLTGALGDVLSPTAQQLATITGNLTNTLTNLLSSLTSGVLDPVLTNVNSAVLKPLEGLLGLSLAGADVRGQYPSCGSPQLVG